MPTLMSRSMSASRLTMVIRCMTMSMILRSRDCHLSRAALLKLWLAPFFWNFFLDPEMNRPGWDPRPELTVPELISCRPCPRSPGPAHLAGRVPWPLDAGWSRKWLIFRFHWRTMLETERAPDSASDEVLADTSAPESSMGGFSPTRPATRSDMGLARRLSAETWGSWKAGPSEQGTQSPENAQIGGGNPLVLAWAGAVKGPVCVRK